VRTNASTFDNTFRGTSCSSLTLEALKGHTVLAISAIKFLTEVNTFGALSKEAVRTHKMPLINYNHYVIKSGSYF
jgi:hypothetical protein